MNYFCCEINANGSQSFVVHANYKEVRIFCDDVLYVEGLKDYVKIFLATSKVILTVKT